jgi:retron-type reverse transcriptase
MRLEFNLNVKSYQSPPPWILEGVNMSYQLFQSWAKKNKWIATGQISQVNNVITTTYLTPQGGIVRATYDQTADIISLSPIVSS